RLDRRQRGPREARPDAEGVHALDGLALRRRGRAGAPHRAHQPDDARAARHHVGAAAQKEKRPTLVEGGPARSTPQVVADSVEELLALRGRDVGVALLAAALREQLTGLVE